MRIYLNHHWRFTEHFEERLFDEENLDGLEEINVPHTCKEIPFNYCDEESYQMLSGYCKDIYLDEQYKGQRLLLTFEGVAHYAEVYLNGSKVGEHSCGYTAFTYDITNYVKFGVRNRLVVKVDSRESLNQPPFGNVIDYLTYGGIYRDIYLEIKNDCYIEDVFVTTPEVMGKCKSLEATITLAKAKEHASVRFYLKATSMSKMGQDKRYLGELVMNDKSATFQTVIDEVECWDIDNPTLYELITELVVDDVTVDQNITRFGFRTATFTVDGFFLNGKKIKLRGLNRHQCYPYVGYAMPKSAQCLDADILKNELCVNAVRTSHYPQSKYFIDRCDELGLLVFTEIPGWQHIGDKAWQQIAIENTKEMVRQYRNHPSIILWGVRINESQDSHDFYVQTGQAAKSLDTSRATTGVRYIKKSELLEDIYAYNDFVHDGTNEATSKKKHVTTDRSKGYLISEFNGHMYPTKPFDDELHRLEHTLRHARVLDSAYADDEIAGAFGWCMFDYNTHKDFGSGDRICYHGVLDMFRNPKDAAVIYQMQGETTPILEVSSSMDIGEYPGGILSDVYVYTNADSVKMYKNDELISEYDAHTTKFSHLPHGPVKINDFIGNQLIEKEGYSRKVSGLVKQLLQSVMEDGLNHLSLRAKLTAARLMMLHGFKIEDGVALYSKYISGWGEASKVYRFEAIKNGRVVKTVTKAANALVHYEVKVDHTELVEESSYDVASIRLVALDAYGNRLPYYQQPIQFETTGDISLIGPKMISFVGGRAGTYVKTVGKEGKGELIILDAMGQKECIQFSVTISKEYQRG